MIENIKESLSESDNQPVSVQWDFWAGKLTEIRARITTLAR